MQESDKSNQEKILLFLSEHIYSQAFAETHRMWEDRYKKTVETLTHKIYGSWDWSEQTRKDFYDKQIQAQMKDITKRLVALVATENTNETD